MLGSERNWGVPNKIRVVRNRFSKISVLRNIYWLVPGRISLPPSYCSGTKTILITITTQQLILNIILPLIKTMRHCLLTVFVFTLNIGPERFKYVTVKCAQTPSSILISIYLWVVKAWVQSLQCIPNSAFYRYPFKFCTQKNRARFEFRKSKFKNMRVTQNLRVSRLGTIVKINIY